MRLRLKLTIPLLLFRAAAAVPEHCVRNACPLCGPPDPPLLHALPPEATAAASWSRWARRRTEQSPQCSPSIHTYTPLFHTSGTYARLFMMYACMFGSVCMMYIHGHLVCMCVYGCMRVCCILLPFTVCTLCICPHVYMDVYGRSYIQRECMYGWLHACVQLMYYWLRHVTYLGMPAMYVKYV